MKNDAREIIRALPCAACGHAPPSDPAHIKSRGAGAKFEEFEMVPFCRPCHVFQHKKGFNSLCDKYPALRKELEKKGWYFDHFFKKWLNEKPEKKR